MRPGMELNPIGTQMVPSLIIRVNLISGEDALERMGILLAVQVTTQSSLRVAKAISETRKFMSTSPATTLQTLPFITRLLRFVTIPIGNKNPLLSGT